jgi:hypothetical protein
MPTVYIETTIPSYLVARRSRDLVVSAHQQVTHEWWTDARRGFELFVSEAVLSEIRAGDPKYAAKRTKLVSNIEVLRFTPDVEDLIFEYERRLGLSGAASSDLPHFAYSVAYNMDYLLTWNCRHIANGHVIKRLLAANDALGRPTPIIITPEELIADLSDEVQ